MALTVLGSHWRHVPANGSYCSGSTLEACSCKWLLLFWVHTGGIFLQMALTVLGPHWRHVPANGSYCSGFTLEACSCKWLLLFWVHTGGMFLQMALTVLGSCAGWPLMCLDCSQSLHQNTTSRPNSAIRRKIAVSQQLFVEAVRPDLQSVNLPFNG